MPVDALRGADVVVYPGEWLAIEGPSGGGKSTLLDIIGLLDVPSGGQYFLGGEDATRADERRRAAWRSERFAFVFQKFHLLDRRSVVDNVELGLLYRGITHNERSIRARSALDAVGLGSVHDQTVNTLSGGQRQRVAIARALASGAPIVLADEPTGNLDSENAQSVIDALRKVNRTGATVVLVTHSAEIARHASRRITIRDGEASAGSSDISPLDGCSGEALPPPIVPGRASVLRFRDLLADARESLRSRMGRTAVLISAIAVGVGLAVATLGMSQSAAAQVGDAFDAHLNRDVEVAWSADDTLSEQPPSVIATIPDRLHALAGVESAATITLLSESVVRVNHLREAVRPPVLAASSGIVQASRMAVEWASGHPARIETNEVLVGSALAAQLDLGPIDSRPSIDVDGRVAVVVGLITSSPRDPVITGGVVGTEEFFARSGRASTRAWMVTRAGAAQQVARQAPSVIDPYQPQRLDVIAPPDPQQLRGEIEAGVASTLISVTAIALLGAVGAVTNSMMLAVNERRAEFGLRRGLGARGLHIRSLVLVESAGIGLVGGVVGLGVGLGVVLVVTIAHHWVPVFDPVLAPVAVLAGIVVGVLGGLVPTIRASRIQPAAALRA